MSAPVAARDPSATPRFAQILLRAECVRCSGSVPVDGPWSQERCPDCGEVVGVPLRALGKALQTYEERWPRVDHDIGSRFNQGAVAWTLVVRATPPCCAAPATRVVEGDGGMVQACDACGARLPALPMPEGARREARSAVWAIGADLPPERRTAVAPKSLAVTCPSCGGAVQAEAGHGRVTRCAFCSSSVTLSDEAWRALHPPRAARGWYVRLEGPSVPEQQRLKDERQREADEQRKAEAAERKRKQAEAAARKKAEKAEKAARAAEARALEEAQLAVERAKWRRIELLGVVVISLYGLVATAALLMISSWLSLRIGVVRLRPGFLWVDAVAIGGAAFLGITALASNLWLGKKRNAGWSDDGSEHGGALVIGATVPLIGLFFGLAGFLAPLLRSVKPRQRRVIRASPAILLLIPAWSIFTTHLLIYGTGLPLFTLLQRFGD